MTELTLERLAELETLEREYQVSARDKTVPVAICFALQKRLQDAVYLDRVELLAAAKRLAELESALEFLSNDAACHMKALLSVAPDEETGDVTAAGMLEFARRLGWPGIESGKGGADG